MGTETVLGRRAQIKGALQPFADAWKALQRSGFADAPRGTALMYEPPNPRFLGPSIHDLERLSEVFDQMVEEDGGSRL